VLYVEMLDLPEAPGLKHGWGMRRLRGPPDSERDPLGKLEYGPSDPVTGIREKVSRPWPAGPGQQAQANPPAGYIIRGELACRPGYTSPL
jgi:hypothetical protein